MAYLIDACRQGKQLSSAQLMEVMGEFKDPNTTLAVNHIKAAITTEGVPYFGTTPEEAIASAADGLKL